MSHSSGPAIRRVLLRRGRLRRQDSAACDVQGLGIHSVRFISKPAPMASTRLARITRYRQILDLVAWHVDPALVDKHLQTVCEEPVGSKLAILVIAAARAQLVFQMRVDVVGMDWQRQAG